MKNFILILVLLLAGCASAPKPLAEKSKFSWTNRAQRLLIDPNGIPAEHYAMIQDALVNSDRFVVIDRPQDVDTIQREKNRTDPDMVKSRWLEWSKRYAIGGVVVAHVQCTIKGSERFCHQYLAIHNTETGELVAQAEGSNSAMTAVSYDYIVPDWNKTAEALVEEFNKNESKMETRRVIAEVKKAPVEEKQLLPAEEAPRASEPAPVTTAPAKAAEPVAATPAVTAPKVEAPVASNTEPVKPQQVEAPKQPTAPEAKPAEPTSQAPAKPEVAKEGN